MKLEDLHDLMCKKNSRFYTRLFKEISTDDLISISDTCLLEKIPDIEVLTLIKNELEWKNKDTESKIELNALKELNVKLKENKIIPINWLQRARKKLQLLQNSPDKVYNPSHSVYVILMDYFDRDKTYGVYVGETFITVEERFQEHISGIKSGKGVKKRGIQLLRSLMLYSPKKITDRQSHIYESAVHYCLGTVKTKYGKNSRNLRVNGNGKNIPYTKWPEYFQKRLKKNLIKN